MTDDDRLAEVLKENIDLKMDLTREKIRCGELLSQIGALTEDLIYVRIRLRDQTNQMQITHQELRDRLAEVRMLYVDAANRARAAEADARRLREENAELR